MFAYLPRNPLSNNFSPVLTAVLPNGLLTLFCLQTSPILSFLCCNGFVSRVSWSYVPKNEWTSSRCSRFPILSWLYGKGSKYVLSYIILMNQSILSLMVERLRTLVELLRTLRSSIMKKLSLYKEYPRKTSYELSHYLIQSLRMKKKASYTGEAEKAACTVRVSVVKQLIW